MYQLILVIHVLISILLVVLILIQCGKGAGMGMSFGSGASNTVFGSQGTGDFLFKLTCILALLFFVTSVSLSSLMSIQAKTADLEFLPQDSNMPNVVAPIPVKNIPVKNIQKNK